MFSDSLHTFQYFVRNVTYRSLKANHNTAKKMIDRTEDITIFRYLFFTVKYFQKMILKRGTTANHNTGKI